MAEENKSNFLNIPINQKDINPEMWIEKAVNLVAMTVLENQEKFAAGVGFLEAVMVDKIKDHDRRFSTIKGTYAERVKVIEAYWEEAVGSPDAISHQVKMFNIAQAKFKDMVQMIHDLKLKEKVYMTKDKRRPDTTDEQPEEEAEEE